MHLNYLQIMIYLFFNAHIRSNHMSNMPENGSVTVSCLVKLRLKINCPSYLREGIIFQKEVKHQNKAANISKKLNTNKPLNTYTE